MWSSLAALTYARTTGKGQSIDVAQYEAIHKTLGGTMVEYFQNGIVRSDPEIARRDSSRSTRSRQSTDGS